MNIRGISVVDLIEKMMMEDQLGCFGNLQQRLNSVSMRVRRGCKTENVTKKDNDETGDVARERSKDVNKNMRVMDLFTNKSRCIVHKNNEIRILSRALEE